MTTYYHTKMTQIMYLECNKTFFFLSPPHLLTFVSVCELSQGGGCVCVGWFLKEETDGGGGWGGWILNRCLKVPPLQGGVDQGFSDRTRMEKKHVRCKDYTDTIGIMQNRTFPVVDFLRPKNDGPRNRKLAIIVNQRRVVLNAGEKEGRSEGSGRAAGEQCRGRC
jgi:hypothetical protein